MTHKPTLMPCLIGLLVMLAALIAPFGEALAQDQAPARQLNAVDLPMGDAHVQPFQDMVYLLDEGEQLVAARALENRGDFLPVTTPWIDFGDQDRPIWLLMRVRNPAERSGEWMLDIQRPFADELLVAKVDQGAVSQVLLDIDNTMPFSARPVASQYLVAPLIMDAGETAEILIGLRSSTGSWMPVTFATPERMRTAHMQEARFNWTINGAILALVIAALFMARLVGWRLALGFAGYAGLSALFVANNEGYLHRFFLTETMWVYEPANLILLCGMMLALLQFARIFAGLGASHPRFAKAVKAMQWALAGLSLLSALAWQVDAVRWLVFIVVPVVALTYLAIAVTAWRSKVLGAVPFIAGSCAIALTVMVMAAVLLSPGQVPMTIALDYFHATLLFESLAFFIAIVVRMLAMQEDLNRSLQAEVAVTQEKLELAHALQESRNRFDAARGAAETMRMRLQSTSHDLQQPMIALRQNLQRVADQDGEAAGKLESALDYLEQVTASGLAQEPLDESQAGEKPDEGAETFPVSVVLQNCATMFRSEAEAAGAQLGMRASSANVHTDPVALMRSVSNLVSNAIKHADASKILIGAQARADHIAIRVIDNGKGMNEGEIARFSQRSGKGEHSDGHGLGLALVHEFAAKPGHGVAIRSEPGKGTAMTLKVPLGR